MYKISPINSTFIRDYFIRGLEAEILTKIKRLAKRLAEAEIGPKK